MKNTSFFAALIYTSASLAAAGGFFLFTLLRDYPWVARIGGTSWIFLLSMIVLMPMVIPLVKKRIEK